MKWTLRIDEAKEDELYDDGTKRPSWMWVWSENDVVCGKPVHKDNDLTEFQLIAAAPDLLEALKCIVEYMDAGDYRSNRMTEILNSARAAIAKAEEADDDD